MVNDKNKRSEKKLNYVYCSICNHKCNTIYHLNEHIRVHTNETPFHCTVCSYKCKQSGNLKRHLRITHNQKPFKCTMCSYRSKYCSLLYAHRKKAHNYGTYSCSKCQYRSKTFERLKLHMTVHSSLTPYHCPLCTFKCKRPDVLNQHKRKHENLQRYKCTSCDYKTNHSYHLKVHIRTHTNEKPYECTICDSKFKQPNALKSHLLIHNNEKPFVCKVCDYRCRQGAHLKVHMMIHNNETPIRCSLCSYATRTNAELKKHMKTHKKCDLCSFVSCGANQFKKHMKWHDDGEKEDENATTKINIPHQDQDELFEEHMKSLHASKITQLSNKNLIKKDGETIGKTTSGEITEEYKTNISSSDTTINKTDNRAVQKDFPCPFCLNKFKGRSSLRIHMRKHKRCTICGYVSKDFKDFKKHNISHKSITHKDSNKYQCALCPKISKTNRAYELHVRIHKTCPICEFVSNDLKHYNKHMKSHSSPQVPKEKIPCTLYRRKAKDIAALKRHMLIHKKCLVCSYVSKSLKQFDKHLRFHPNQTRQEISHNVGVANKYDKEKENENEVIGDQTKDRLTVANKIVDCINVEETFRRGCVNEIENFRRGCVDETENDRTVASSSIYNEENIIETNNLDNSMVSQSNLNMWNNNVRGDNIDTILNYKKSLLVAFLKDSVVDISKNEGTDKENLPYNEYLTADDARDCMVYEDMKNLLDIDAVFDDYIR